MIVIFVRFQSSYLCKSLVIYLLPTNSRVAIYFICVTLLSVSLGCTAGSYRVYIYICTVIQTRQLTASLENSGDHHVPTCARSGSPCVASTTNCKGRTQTLRSKQSSSRSILWWEQGPRVLFLPQITCLCRRSKWRLLHNDGFEPHLILRQTCCSFLSICAGLNHNS